MVSVARSQHSNVSVVSAGLKTLRFGIDLSPEYSLNEVSDYLNL